jgi:hypothetical protein
MLMTKGYVKADATLINPQGFNGELECAILCVVEETDVSRNGSLAYNRIKEWVTAPRFNIHRKGATPYMSEFNSTHWVQCANRRANCPVLDQDTRIVVIQVEPIDKPVPPDAFKKQLLNEAPYFLRHVLSFHLPPSSGDRLYLPLLETEAKREAMAATRSEKSVDVIRKLMTLAEGHKVFEKTATEIAEEWQKSFPNDKPPGPSALGKAINDFKHSLEAGDCWVRTRLLHGKTHYIIAPKRVVEKIEAGNWKFIYADNGEVESVMIDPDDPEAGDGSWTKQDEVEFWSTFVED